MHLQQTVNDEIRRTHEQLADNIALRESQFNILARDLKNPAFRAQRESLSQLQVRVPILKPKKYSIILNILMICYLLVTG